ncbi:MAG: hypothetical protein RIM99_19740 [Cyclobacteriaceae bacterium]
MMDVNKTTDFAINSRQSNTFEQMKNVAVFVILTLLCIPLLQAQVKVGAKATGRHAKAINSAKEARAQTKTRREQLRQIKDQKKAVNKYKARYKKLKKERLEELNQDSVKVVVFTKQDSIAIAEEILNETNFPLEYKELILNPLSIDSLALASIDSSAYDPEKILESQAKEYLPDELEQPGESPLDGLPGNPAENGLDQSGVDVLKKPSKPNPNLVKPEAARKLFKKIDPEQFQKIQTDITKLKKKYSSLPDTRFPEEGRKRNSLEDIPFKKRLYFGGTINISSTDPFILDTNLQAGYWINKKWMAGAGLLIREQFSNDTTALTGDAHGYSLFTRYDILKQFYAWGEMQRQVNRSIINNESTKPAKWQEAYLIGIGREFKLGPVKMTTLVMYDLNFRNNDLNGRPLVFRLGVQFSKKP